MSKKYQVIARKYRPQRFSEVVGQEAVLQTLKNAIRRESLAHAYLFSGSRGIGKTTLARLFAKSLNCNSLEADGEPCNKCSSCLAIASGQSLDVIEIDGASNRGIDDIREINETVAFAPSHGKYKIYIIDEVHMLTKEAFNALLKTLEEPPERAKFFFATTEPHKILPTILSRCQRFDLGRLLPSQIVTKLEEIATDLGRTVEAEALHLLAQFADGSLRDAESLFDQILCFADGTITAKEVRTALGLVPQDLFFALDTAFAEERIAYAFELTEELYKSGKDLAHFLQQLIEHFRHITVAKSRGKDALEMAPGLAGLYATSGTYYSGPQCLAILDLLLKAETQFARSANPRTFLELTLLQLLRIKHRIPIEALVRRLSELEQSLKVVEQPVLQTTAQKSQVTETVVAKPVVQMAESAVEQPVLQTTAQKPQITEPVVAKPVVQMAESAAEQPVLQTTAQKPQVTEQVVAKPVVQVAESAVEKPVLQTTAQKQQVTETVVAKPVVQVAESAVEKPALQTTAQKPQVTEPGTAPPELKAVPFNPFRKTEPAASTRPSPSKHPSHYDTIMRFAAVELEGTIKK